MTARRITADGLRRLAPQRRAPFVLGWIGSTVRADRDVTPEQMVSEVREALQAFEQSEREGPS